MKGNTQGLFGSGPLVVVHPMEEQSKNEKMLKKCIFFMLNGHLTTNYCVIIMSMPLLIAVGV